MQAATWARFSVCFCSRFCIFATRSPSPKGDLLLPGHPHTHPHASHYDEIRTAMPRSGPISLNLPAFSGVTRKLILANVGAFFPILLLRWLTPHLADLLLSHLCLEPRAGAHREIWRRPPYSFLEQGFPAIPAGLLTPFFTCSR